MNLTTSFHQTIVSGLDKEEVLRRITLKTKSPDYEFEQRNPLFNGTIHNNTFRISAILKVPQNALPLVDGRVEKTSHGAIVFLRLKLFPAAYLFLGISFALCICCSTVFLFIAKYPAAAIIALLLGVFNYLILSINFHRKARETIRLISDLLADPTE